MMQNYCKNLNQVSKEQLLEKNQSKVTIQASNQYLDDLIDPTFQGVNRLFVLSFENNRNRIVDTK